MNWVRDPSDPSSDFEEFHLDDGMFVFAFASELFPRLEWGNFLTSLHISHALFRDSFDHWYHKGVFGLGDERALIEYMESITVEFSPVVALGLSKGSWAALKFGKLAGVDRVIAISPHSGCGEHTVHEFPSRWHHRVADNRLPYPGADFRIDDLKPLYAVDPIPHVHAYVSDGVGSHSESPEVDRIMAERIRAKAITFIPGYTHGGPNNLAIAIRDNGMLKDELLGLQHG